MTDRLRLHFNLYRPSTVGGEGPEIIRSYMVLASPWILPGSGVASVVPLSAGAPSPAHAAVVRETGGAQAAFTAAVSEILALPGNENLHSIPKDLSKGEPW